MFFHGFNYTRAMSEDRTEDGPGAARLDRWLFGVRLFKSRSLAAQAVTGGKVHLNGDRVKPSREVREGDVVTFVRGAVEFECTVVAIPARRGPATEAARCYVESQASEARRAEFSKRMKVAAALTPRPDERPDKHDRQALRRLRGRN
jgi:ribosome-associated heat shock protein Hsp15